MKNGDLVMLEGTSRHGKQRVDLHGNPWTIEAQGVFNGNEAVRLKSHSESFNIGQGRKIHDGRWVYLKDDPNFRVICTEETLANILSENIKTDWTLS